MITASHGQHIRELAIPANARKVEFQYARRKAYAFGWYEYHAGCGFDVICLVAAYSVGKDKDLVDFNIVVPCGSFPRTTIAENLAAINTALADKAGSEIGRELFLSNAKRAENAKRLGPVADFLRWNGEVTE